MALSKVQVTKWSAMIEAMAQEASIVAGLTNGMYQADSNGAKVINIQKISLGSIGNYVPGTPLTYADLTDSQIDVALDQRKVFTFKVEDVDTAQTNIDVKNVAIQQNGKLLALEADKYVFGLYSKAGKQINDGDNPAGALDLNSANVEDTILEVKEWMDSKSVGSDRALVVEPWFLNKMIKAGLTRQTGIGDEAYVNGFVGKIFGFDVYVSNALTAGHQIALTPRAIPFATQMNKVETIQHPDFFGEAVRALYVFGADVLFPDEFVDIWVAKAAEA